MSEKRFIYEEEHYNFPVKKRIRDTQNNETYDLRECCDVLNEKQELIEELQVSDEMGWKRAEHFEKKCPKELHNKKMYIKRLEYKVQKFKEENEQLRKTINEVIELLLKEVDLFSDKATEHDIIAYKEMNQFDNKDAYYMCISTKKVIQMLKRCLNE